jgi:hypothetical protein
LLDPNDRFIFFNERGKRNQRAYQDEIVEMPDVRLNDVTLVRDHVSKPLHGIKPAPLIVEEWKNHILINQARAK